VEPPLLPVEVLPPKLMPLKKKKNPKNPKKM
jgi:hypothetical protein